MNRSEVASILSKANFTFAKTMKQIPHCWSVRKEWRSQILFEKVVKYIRENGVDEYFMGKRYTYFYANKHKYWTMGAPIKKTKIINRAKVYIFKKINIEHYQDIKLQAQKEGILFGKNTEMYGVFDMDNNLTGITGILFGKGKAVLKCSYVPKKYRGKSLLRLMITERMKIISQKQKGINNVTANCTRMSLKEHIRCGAKVLNRYKNGITKVIYKNK